MSLNHTANEEHYFQFNKVKATATYGLLPAADVPPLYALTSISALQFDHCGQRFASAALDGTVCTWQLEVGRRNNIRPTESSLCFNGHASLLSQTYKLFRMCLLTCGVDGTVKLVELNDSPGVKV